MSENLCVRDLRVLARIVGRGRVQASELADIASTGGLYLSLARLAAEGLVVKVERGVYKATERGRHVLMSILSEIESGLEPAEA